MTAHPAVPQAPNVSPTSQDDRAGSPTLRANELNLFDETVVAISSVGPTYSLAATMGLLFVAVAYAGPAAVIVSFLPMLFIAVAYFYLNRRDPNCGASYAWISKLVSPAVGWFNGWVQLAASVLFCIAAPVLAADYTLQFVHSVGWTSQTLTNAWLVAGLAAVWLGFITFITVYSVRWTANAQWVFLIIQYGVVVVTSIWGIAKVAIHHPAGSTGFHWSWLNPLSLHGYEGLAAGVVLGLFLFWGWDTAVNLNEESKNATKTPGRAVIISMFFLDFIFVLNIVAAQMLVPEKQLASQGANLLFYFSEQVGGQGLGYLMIFAVLASTVADAQTTLLPASRLTLSMSRDGVFPRLFSVIHGDYQTPLVGTLIIAGLALLGIIVRTASPTVNAGYGNLINDIGVLVAVYYGATGVACAWAYRKVAFQSGRFFVSGILLPFLAGLFCFWVGYEVVHQSGLAASADVLVVLALGVPLVWVAQRLTRSDFFKQQPVAYASITSEPELVVNRIAPEQPGSPLESRRGP
jgi:amino acid transporter